MKKTYLMVLSLLILPLSFIFGNSSASAEELVLRYNQWFPSGHWSQKEGLYKYFDKIAEVTQGRVRVEPSAKPLAPPNRNYQAVANGVADIAWGPHGYTPGVFPLTEMVELPFITHDAGKSSTAYWRLWKKYFEQTGMQNEVVTLAMHVTVGGNIHMREKPVTSLADLKGKKIRIPTPVVARALKEVGAVPVSGPISELREMMSRGIVDGTALADDLVAAFKLGDHITKTTVIPGGLYSNSAFIILNKESWAKISPSDQDAIMKISGEALSTKMGTLWQTNADKAQSVLKEKMQDDLQQASPDFIGELAQAFEGAKKRWFNAANDKGIKGQEAFDFYQKQLSDLK